VWANASFEAVDTLALCATRHLERAAGAAALAVAQAGSSGAPVVTGAHLDASPASAFRTSDWDKPNCRAICDGLTPALKAARTAFSFPGVK
jgi:hypothetical protein